MTYLCVNGTRNYIMYKIGNYNQNDKMINLICDNYPMILVLNRFGIALGFGELTVEQVCQKNNVDTSAFLSVVNLLITDNKLQFANCCSTTSSTLGIVQYLKNSHTYFLDYKLPSIRTSLVATLSRKKNELSDMIIRYFDEYVSEVKRHMTYEDEKVFTYVDRLLEGEEVSGYSIEVFSKIHDDIEQRLTEFKNVIIMYYPESSSNELNTVLFDILSCAEDMSSHSDIEDYIFVPLIKTIEQEKLESNES